MRVLITGITGFVGGHLAHFLSTKKGLQIYGLSRRHSDPKKKIYSCDIRDGKKVEALVRRIKPEQIYHLAAVSSPSFSWENPKETFENNLIGTLNLLEAVRRSKISTQIHIAGSAYEYGIPKKAVASIDETMPLEPLSPYAVSKVAQDHLACQYFHHYGLSLVRTRAFNHIGPGQSAQFVTASFARQIARIEQGLQEPLLRVGNLDGVRDYTDVRDVVRAYHLALEKGKRGEVYNIASNQGHTIRQILDIFKALSPVKIRVQQDPALLRRHDFPRLVGNSKKFNLQTGWRPKIALEKSLEDILHYWRGQVKLKKGKA